MFDPETEKYTRFEEVQQTYDVKPAKNGDVWFTAPRDKQDRQGRRQDHENHAVDDAHAEVLSPAEWNWTPTARFGSANSMPASSRHFDPKTETFKEYTLPGPDPTPYAMGIDADGNIWYDSHHQDTVGMFNPKTEKVTEYPFPHSELCMREFFLDKQGRMWYGTNPNNRVGYFYLTGKKGSAMASNQ